MTKPLAFIAVTGFALSLLFFTLAFLVAGGQVFHRERPLAAIRPLIDLATHKEWRWDGGDTLAVNAPMVLQYQAGGPPHVTVTGPVDLLQHVRVGGGQIGADNRHSLEGSRRRNGEKLTGVVGGMPIRKFVINGGQRLLLGHIDQDSLDIRVNGGGGSVSAQGRVGNLNLVISGHGNANLAGLTARDAKVAIFGHGDATLAPRHSLYLTIVGSGIVRLQTRPASIEKTIIGSGRIIALQPETPVEPPRSAQRPVPPVPPIPSVPAENPTGLSQGEARSFLVTGDGIRDLGHFVQGDMKVIIAAGGSASATGKVDRLTVMVSGSGNARLADLSARQASVTITGSGDVTIAPQDEAHITILGSGNVYLASKPRKIDQNIIGSGRVIERY